MKIIFEYDNYNIEKEIIMKKREKVEFCKNILGRKFNYQDSIKVFETMQDLLADCSSTDGLTECGVGEVLSFIGDLYEKGEADGSPIVFPRDNQIQCIVRNFERLARKRGIDIFAGKFGTSWDSFYRNQYRFKLRAEVLRGEGELTGNLIQIRNTYADGILVEFGKDLTKKGDDLSPLEEELIKRKFKAVIISHGHADHNGLIHMIRREIPVFMGERTLKLYKISHPDVDTSHFFAYRDGQAFEVGSPSCPINVTPYLCDHSAPDSYMLLFEYNGRSILYTGDFRSTGRKNFSKLLARLPETVTTLICENTNCGDFQENMPTENELSERMYRIMHASRKPVFILCPTGNIDRIVSAYRASTKSSRDFLIDLEQERILETLGGSVPNAKSFPGVYVYFKSAPADANKPFIDVRGKTVSIDELAARSDYTMIVKTSTIGYLKKLVLRGADLCGATLIYSLWSGYQEEACMGQFLNEITALGIRVEICHTSGHAMQKDIEALINKTKPKECIFVHQKKLGEKSLGGLDDENGCGS